MSVKGRIGIIGASGFLGGELARQASGSGWQVVGFSRRPPALDDAVADWRDWGGDPDVAGLDVLVNLAGASIAKRWTATNRKIFRESRVGVTETLVRAIEKAVNPPKVLLNGSAVGIYGDRGDEVLREDTPVGEGFLAGLCRDWEAAADSVKTMGVRVLKWRTGVVLGRGGEAWTKMRMTFALGLGGRFGNGRQWMPWIHVQDLAGAMLHAINEGLSGPINGTAPEPERNADFARMLAGALHRPAFLHAPGWALKIALGDFGGVLLESQRAVPEALLESGFRFRFPTLPEALDDLV